MSIYNIPLLVSLPLLLSLSVRADLDISGYIDCGVEGFVARNQRRCFRTRVEGDPCNPTNCSSTIIPRTNFSINLQPIEGSDGLQTKFWSPGKIRNPPRDYQNNRHCQYHLGCPAGQALFFGFMTGNFDLEPAVDGFCLDYVFIEDFSEGSFSICGSQSQRVWMRAAPLRVEFRSNTGNRHPGFQIDAICARPELANAPNCTTPDNTGATGRRKRALTVNKRNVVPLIGNSLRLPREGSLQYKNNKLRVVVSGSVVREFRSIRRVIFWNGLSGVRVFSGSTDQFIFGSGQLKIINYCAYYYTFDIPPQLEPNEAETNLITLLLNATVAFYRDEDTEDEPPATPTTPPTDPPTKYPPHHYYVKVGVSYKKHYKRNSLTPPPTTDPRVSEVALAAALEWQEACNSFLRESALSYLLILTENGILP